MKKNKITKYLLWAFSILLLFILLGGVIGISYFNNMWFKEKTDYLKITSDYKPINFNWDKNKYGDYTENNDAILISSELTEINDNLSFQFDTGDPTTRIRRNFVDFLKKKGLNVIEIAKDDKKYIELLNINLGNSQTTLEMVLIDERYVNPIIPEDTIINIRVGTLGADFIDDDITEIDFKNQQIKFYKKREEWMTSLDKFQQFDYAGRRFMLPCIIDKNEIELFYDSGSSAFGLITTKSRFSNYSDSNTKAIVYNSNMHGDPIPIVHKTTEEILNIGGLDLKLKRVSYVDMYSNFQGLISPFTRIGGWLGNKPFIDYSLIFDMTKDEFIVVEK